MKKLTSTLTMVLLCLYVSAQVGKLDPSFNGIGSRITNATNTPDKYEIASAISFTANGKILVAGRVDNDNSFLLLRYTNGGQLDNSFGNGGVVWEQTVSGRAYGMALQSDGKIVLVGWITPGSRDFCIMRFNDNGVLDNTFGTGGIVTTAIGADNDEAHGVAIQSDGKIVVTGFSINSVTHKTDFVTVRYNDDGGLDGSFGTGGIVTTDFNNFDVASAVAIDKTTGAITVAGTSNIDYEDNKYTGVGSGDFAVARYTSNGTPDGSFGTGGKATFNAGSTSTYDEAYSMAVQPDGKLVLAGIAKRISTKGGNSDAAVIRVTTAGTLDNTFGTGGSGKVIADYAGVDSDDDIQGVALQSDGKIIIGGTVEAFNQPKPSGLLLMRFTPAGVLDVTFDGDGKSAVDIEPTDNDKGYAIALKDSRIYVAGYSGDPKDILLAAFQNDGTSLPIVLTQFSGQKQNSKVVLKWTTSSEENVAQFVIERSSDGKTFKAIGNVPAIGNSSLTQNYSFDDNSPLTATNNLYRLQVQDVSGTVTYSRVVIIKADAGVTTSLQVFPNPVKNELQVQIPDGFKGTTSLQVFGLNGHLVKVNRINTNGTALNTSIDITALPTGVYMLKVTDGNSSVTTRFEKQ